MGVIIIGRCGSCGGPVEIQKAWMGVYPETPSCRRCGRTAKAKGPVIEMDEKKGEFGQ